MQRISPTELDTFLADIERQLKSFEDLISKGILEKGDAFCAEIAGTSIASIAFFVGESKNGVRYKLKKLKQKGFLVSHNSPGKTTRWWPAGLAEKLLQGGKGCVNRQG
jgi:hypothetical protein